MDYIKALVSKIYLPFKRFFEKPAEPTILSGDPKAYWSSHTVHVPTHPLSTAAESLDYFHWRCEQYPGYLELMPVAGLNGLNILDFGCGPGHDLVGMSHYSSPRSIFGLDVSQKAVDIATQRLSLHNFAHDITVKLTTDFSNFPPKFFDYIHSSGVLHHIDDLEVRLEWMKEILKDDGRIRIMVYNQNSIWRNLYVPYELQLKKKIIAKDLPIDIAFRMSTDGLECPISRSFTSDSFSSIALRAELKTRLVGTAISKTELYCYKKYAKKSLSDATFAKEYKDFISEIKVQKNGDLSWNHTTPGISLVLELTKI